MECTESFTSLLSEFQCVFTVPSFQTFLYLMTGWVLSHRRRFVTELIWSSGCTRRGHHSCYHRFFSQAAWTLDALCEVLAKLVVRVFAPTGMIELAVDDTLCRKRGLTVYGTGMHHDPLISSRAKPLTSWGHDWVVVTLIVRRPFWAPTKVWSLGIAYRLYRNRQGLTKGKKKGKKQKPAQAEPQPPHSSGTGSGTDFSGGKLVSRPKADRQRRQRLRWSQRAAEASVQCRVDQSRTSQRRVVRTGTRSDPRQEGRSSQEGKATARHGELGRRWQAALANLVFNQFGLHATLTVKTMQALYYKAGKDRLLTIVLVRDVLGKRPDQMFYCTCLDWDARKILSDILGPLVDRGDLRKLQATAGSGRSGQPQGKGSTTYCANGVCDPQPDRDLVSSSRSSPSAISRSALVSPEERAILRRHAHHPAAYELAGQDSYTAFEKQYCEKGSCPDCRFPQSCRLTRAGRSRHGRMPKTSITTTQPAVDR